MLKQLTSTIVMVRPDTFGFNAETAATNEFQRKPTESEKELRKSAREEFEVMVSVLRSHGIHITVLPSPRGKVVPDAVFPNNWFSHHSGGALVVYPMLAPNRRLERQPQALKKALSGIVLIKDTIDLTSLEQEGNYLEGTGSLVLDRIHNVAFAALSPRTTTAALDVFGKRMGFEVMTFRAMGKIQIYHTNILMSVGDGFVVVCLDSIRERGDSQRVKDKILALGHTLIPIRLDQMNAFCGNVLHVTTQDGKKKIILSQTAFDAYTTGEKQQLSKFGELVPVSIHTIEQIGGGSARCMLAEVFA